MSAQLNLDDINKQFQKAQEEKRQALSQKKHAGKRTYIIAGIAAVAVIAMIITFVVLRLNSGYVKTHDVLSSEEEYKEQYTQVTSTDKYLGINNIIRIDGLTAHVGLVNSIGNEYAVSIKIYNSDSGEVFYNSGSIMPGSVIHMATFAKEVDDIDKLAMDYTIYDFTGIEQGTFEADVDFVLFEDSDSDSKDKNTDDKNSGDKNSGDESSEEKDAGDEGSVDGTEDNSTEDAAANEADSADTNTNDADTSEE